jgi:hypothetical protein
MKLVFSFLFLSLFAFQVNAQPAQRRAAKEKKQEVKADETIRTAGGN